MNALLLRKSLTLDLLSDQERKFGPVYAAKCLNCKKIIFQFGEIPLLSIITRTWAILATVHGKGLYLTQLGEGSPYTGGGRPIVHHFGECHGMLHV